MLRGKTIEEIVNRWSSELETHVREFTKFAGEVAVWDRALIENGNNVSISAHTHGFGSHAVYIARSVVRDCPGGRAGTKRHRPIA